MRPLKDEVFAYVRRAYGVEPDYPFATAPEFPVLRHRENRKWFALIMDVPGTRLGLESEQPVDVLNLKCSPVLAGALRKQKGILPAYHMNREHWISVLLDGTVPAEDIWPLIDMSFQLTAEKKARPEKGRVIHHEKEQTRKTIRICSSL